MAVLQEAHDSLPPLGSNMAPFVVTARHVPPWADKERMAVRPTSVACRQLPGARLACQQSLAQNTEPWSSTSNHMSTPRAQGHSQLDAGPVFIQQLRWIQGLCPQFLHVARVALFYTSCQTTR